MTKEWTKVAPPKREQCDPYLTPWDQLTNEQKREVCIAFNILAMRPGKAEAERKKAENLLWSFDTRTEEERTTLEGCTTEQWYGYSRVLRKGKVVKGKLVMAPHLFRKIPWQELERRCEELAQATIPLRVSPNMAEVLVELLSKEAKRQDDLARRMVCEHNTIACEAKAKELRECAQNLGDHLRKHKEENNLD